jgi:phosphoribosylformylglycinamidine cyclo-ligase
VERSAWAVPNVFEQIARIGGVSADDMASTFNLGIGFCLIVAPDAADSMVELMAEHDLAAHRIGRVASGSRRVVLD